MVFCQPTLDPPHVWSPYFYLFGFLGIFDFFQGEKKIKIRGWFGGVPPPPQVGKRPYFDNFIFLTPYLTKNKQKLAPFQLPRMYL